MASSAVKMSAVWDRAVEVMSGRTTMLVSIAALTLWLPTVVRTAMALSVGGPATAGGVPTPGTAGLLFLVAVVVAVVTIAGQLALIAAASDPATTRNEAFAIGFRRLPLTLGLALLFGLAIFVLLIPMVVPIAAAVANPAALTSDGMRTAMAGISAGTRGFLGIYFLVLVAIMLWLTARLALLNPVIVNERQGVRSFARSFALTRGLTWKIIGLAILFGVVSGVVILATQSVVGIVFRLLLGGDNAGLVLLLTTAVVAVATSAVTIVWTVFLAQLYVATREAHEAG